MIADDAQVIIRKQFVVARTGNFYPADPKTQRRAGSIPAAYRTQEFLSIVGVPSSSPVVGRATPVESLIQVDQPQTVEPVVTESTVDINSADAPALIALKHVGESTAGDIIAMREERLFDSISDLNNRVPLRGHDWTTHATRLTFGD